MVAPTLCYELNFPRREKRRFIFIVRRLLEVVSHKYLHAALVKESIVGPGW